MLKHGLEVLFILINSIKTNSMLWKKSMALRNQQLEITKWPSIIINILSIEDINDCVICLSEKIDTVVMPCRHMCICLECGKDL